MHLPPIFRADLHIHTCLSPCADWEMTPRKIIQRAREIELDIIAVCDHNTAGNAPPIIHLGKEQGITVFPGMEICTREEVHILAIFDAMDQALALQEIIDASLMGTNNPEIFGYQILADENDYVLGEESQLLLGASSLTTEQAVAAIHQFKGLAIASHIDRPTFGILGQLGFIPPDLPLDAVEISHRTWASPLRHSFLDKIRIPFIVSSDAHYLTQMGCGYTLFEIKVPTLEIKNQDSNNQESCFEIKTPRLRHISKALEQKRFKPQVPGASH